MNIIKERRKVKAICHVCQSPDYNQEKAYFKGGKPNFICNSCGTHWQYGCDGGKYTKLSKETK